MAKYTYRIHVFSREKWVAVSREMPKTYGDGYLAHHRGAPGPRCAMRLVRSDGRIVAEVPALEEAGIGIVAGGPTAAQYLQAARRCIELARRARRPVSLPEHWYGQLDIAVADVDGLLKRLDMERDNSRNRLDT